MTRRAADEAAARRPGGAPAAVDIFDTTLRDGAQFEGISLTVDDKLRVAEQLDWLGVRWIEGGYPLANPKRRRVLRAGALRAEARDRRAGRVRLDPPRRRARSTPTRPCALVEAGVGTACIVGKSSAFHVTAALGTTLDEGVAMVGDSVAFLRAEGMRVFFDAEHFFDGYRADPEFTPAGARGCRQNGAECLVLCDTNGGSLPHEVQAATAAVVAHLGADVQVGIHTQNDSGCAVANSVAARARRGHPRAGHRQRLRRAHRQRQPDDGRPRPPAQAGDPCLPEGRIERLTAVSRHVAELVNLPPHPADPYVGSSAFAHKGGLHTSALGKVGGAAYEHVDPAVVGNHTRVLASATSAVGPAWP